MAKGERFSAGEEVEVTDNGDRHFKRRGRVDKEVPTASDEPGYRVDIEGEERHFWPQQIQRK